MEYKKNEVKAGMMIVVSLVVLLVFLGAIFGVGFGESHKQYRVYLDYIGGISPGSLVKYIGMDVGQVSQITLTDRLENPVEVQLTVRDNIPVKADSRAFITALGIMSEYHIEISPGTAAAEPLPDGSVIPGKEVASYPQLAEDMGIITDQIQVLLDQVNQVLNEENRGHIASMMSAADTLLLDGRSQLLQTMQEFRTLSRTLNTLAGDVNNTMEENRGNLGQLLSNLNASSAESGKLIIDMQATINSLESLINANNSSISEILQSYEVSSQNLEEITRMLKERPWLLIRKAPPPARKLK